MNIEGISPPKLLVILLLLVHKTTKDRSQTTNVLDKTKLMFENCRGCQRYYIVRGDAISSWKLNGFCRAKFGTKFH